MAHPSTHPDRYTFGHHEDGRSRAPVADGTNRKQLAHYISPNYGRAQGNEWNERNYSTGKRPSKRTTSATPRAQTTRDRTPKGTNVWVPQQTDAQRHNLPSVHTA